MLAPRASQAVRTIARGTSQVRQLQSTRSQSSSHKLTSTNGSTFGHRHTATARAATAPAIQHFNTSSKLQASRDSSTIDFFYFPDIDHEEDASANLIRVPIVPDNYDPPRHGAHAPEAEIAVHKPEINTMSLDSVYSSMAELHDGHAIGVDFHAIADKVASNLSSLKIPVEERASMMKQLWSDMVDDIFGLKKKVAA